MKRVGVCMLATLAVGGCETTNEDIGAVAGLAVGVAVGSLFGEGGGQAAAMIVGGAIGGFAGALIGRELDEADQARATAAAETALESEEGGRVIWKSPEDPDVWGYAETAPSAAPVASVERIEPAEDGAKALQAAPEAEPDPVAGGTAHGGPCRDVRNVFYKDGEEYAETVTYCLTDGRWVVLS